MPLPSSGQISMGDINVELGRSRTTANTALAGGSTPTAGSLFGLANSTVNKTAPHRISEFYGYSNATTLTGTIDINENIFRRSGQIFYNGTSLSRTIFGTSTLSTVTLSPADQTIAGQAFNDGGGFCYILITANGSYLADFGDFFSAYVDWNTTAGNAYDIQVSVSSS